MKIAACVCSLMVLAMVPTAYAGKVELTTYYPSAYGEYVNLKSTADSYFATASGNVGIGTTTPGAKLDIGGNPVSAIRTAYLNISGNNSSVADRPYFRGTTAHLVINGGGTTSGGDLYLNYTGDGVTGNVRIRENLFVMSSGVGIGNAAPLAKLAIGSPTSDSAVFQVHVGGGNSYGIVVRTNTYGIHSEGSTYDFYAGGAGTNYGPFTGGHDVRLPQGFSGEPGMIVSSTGDAVIRKNSLSTALLKVGISSVEKDSAVLGVFVSEQEWDKTRLGWYKEDNIDKERFGVVNALGEGRVWVTDINGEIRNGDYITTCAIPGYGMRQEDDLLHNYTVAKVTEEVQWEIVTDFIEWNGKKYKKYLIACTYHSG